jgi:hypothetical protein
MMEEVAPPARDTNKFIDSIAEEMISGSKNARYF